MSTVTYYYCKKCKRGSSNYNGGKCPYCGSTDYYAEQEQENY